jgi:hypothetical protein
MATSKKTEHADRSQGGPGSSHQDAKHPEKQRHLDAEGKPVPGQPTNPSHSRISGGGGERDSHHTHNPGTK